jgi:hypothetical protein
MADLKCGIFPASVEVNFDKASVKFSLFIIFIWYPVWWFLSAMAVNWALGMLFGVRMGFIEAIAGTVILLLVRWTFGIGNSKNN